MLHSFHSFHSFYINKPRPYELLSNLGTYSAASLKHVW